MECYHLSHDLCITGVFQMEAERQQKTQENFVGLDEKVQNLGGLTQGAGSIQLTCLFINFSNAINLI